MDNKLTSFIPKPSTTGPLNTTASRQSAPKVQGAYNFLGVLGFLTLALSLVFVASAFVYRQIILSDIYKPCADNGTCGLAESLKRDRQNLGVETLTRAKRLEMKTANGDSLLNQHIIISPLFRQVLNTLTTEGMSYRQFDFGEKGIVIQGTARRYEDVAFQAQVFGSEQAKGKIQSFNFYDLDLDDKGNVIFKLDLTVEPTILSFSKVVSQ
ncbi:MAG: hypothetical protein UV88_C0003G0010 [Parcubacteria group bacterium GW2011_GWA1_43_21]|uniref:Uncharacterized protein n=2 Tax=Candidatus Vogeliibacteriota TaxID=1817922 RepID=A0A1G2QCS1_9BACT|nr:MAG: hypothetical protein UV50_C0004G0013 [Parcubacteria group bacterium GW2011_GWB1_42_9]KKT10008.1 MAG: hypothetical protein UV88_C0003G0010 [Parcubacteria group bacterium GW2011_GWA1_43_21]OHA58370.1 MAG: hypothetical protein A2370_01495 [Candidatus Vogelbacteria bacterium RIFOXYB1_FULL_42_16]OHA60573.1 MAG: hypothetical protein A2607_00815 [Candidatus Vogelbacteria bacterium RIFOXYD1_FULL_42_15]